MVLKQDENSIIMAIFIINRR